MQKQNPIDDLFRRGLADYRVRPSDERKDAFIREVSGNEGKRPWAGWWYIAGTVLILIGVGAALLLSHNSNVRLADATQVRSGGVKATSGLKPSAQAVTSDGATKAYNSNAAPASCILHPASVTAAEKPAAGLHETAAISPPAEPSAVIKVNETTNAQLTKTDEKINTPEIAAVAPPAAEPKPEPVVKPAEPLVKPKTVNEEKLPATKTRSHPQKNWNISTGIYYTPEWMFNTLNGDKYVNNAGIEGTFHFGNYSVRTGVGLSITNGWHEVLVQSNPYLGAYKALDSITFSWSKDGSKLNPTYYMTGTSVYDTAKEYTYSYVQKRYTYLQVPLLLGYDFWNNSWLRLGVRAGAVMSLLVNTQNLTSTYEAGKDRIVSINNVTPDRIQLNWQAIGGINAAFRLSRRFSIELEPEMRYYFNSVYESSDITTKPWSIGVRAAVLINF
ncbi:MAG: hypothetical protein WCI48_04255 [Bacteroidota bacterium]|jgi:hypothetical protein